MRLLAAAVLWLAACASPMPPGIAAPPASTIVSGSDPSRSSIYLARVEGGVLLIDLGWWGADRALVTGLQRLHAELGDVTAVFITHSHRDHIGGWRSVRHAPFYMAADEVALLFGGEEHGGWVPRLADRVLPGNMPKPGEITVRPMASDTFFVFGRDTLRAFLTPGHTAGSAAYLFRGTVFAGDLITHSTLGGFAPALSAYSDDTAEARRSLASLRQRLAPYEVRAMCTAHLKCGVADEALWRKLLGN